MKKLFIVANWKSNKTIPETEEWLRSFSKELSKSSFKLEDKKIIIAPSFTSLEHANYCSANLKLPVEFAAQNISPFDEGAYTGEESAKQIKELAEYVIIGHSERRRYLLETKEMLEEKVKLANKWNLKTIFCADDEESLIPENVSIITYEPPTSISPAPADTPENAERVAKALKTKTSVGTILYGGNVTSENVNSFTNMPSIGGVLVGKASLDPIEFLNIVKNA